MAGNLLGTRSYYLYTNDVDEEYKVLMDDDIATAVGATKDDTKPNVPKRFKPRGVYVQAIVSNRKVRKFVPCPATDNEFYGADVSQSITIDGVTFFSTGRKGETLTFGTNPPVAAPPAP